MSAFHPAELPQPPREYHYYRTEKEVLNAAALYAYQHMVLRAWEEMRLSGVLTLNGVPTVYICDFAKPASVEQIAKAQQQFWNQGIATLLLIRDPLHVHVVSSMVTPVDPAKATEESIEARLVEKIELAAQAQWAEKLYVQLSTGHYYNAAGREGKFLPQRGVDAYLLTNLSAVRDTLVANGLAPRIAHAFLGRLLFTCYLCERGIIQLPNYFKGKPWCHLRDLLTGCTDPASALYDTLFPALKSVFNSSMFDSELESERSVIEKHPDSFQTILSFLRGDDLAQKGQPTLGFWAYDFRLIPVETVSAIYENFLEGEDSQSKQAAGAFYTPRFLAEVALDLALADMQPLYAPGRRFIDPSCGSGIFLVLLFNRLAAEWTSHQKRRPTPQAKADALLARLDTLRGVDKNLTACRIACFSLYLAFLDQFDPPDVENYKLEFNKKKLPNLLHAQAANRAPEYPVIREADFFDYAPKHQGEFDIVIGNPPWAGRGSKQIAHDFMQQTPALLKTTGRACLLLPSKVFLSQMDAFQASWLTSVTLNKVVQLADYRFILFKEAMCPCTIALFHSGKPAEDHEIEYIAPKVSRSDLRDGLIPMTPADHQWIPLRRLLGAASQGAISMAWKSYLWGTARDHKFLDYLFSFPRLGDYAGTVHEMNSGKKRWGKGQGFQPLKADSKSDRPSDMVWQESDRLVTPELIEGVFCLPSSISLELGEHMRAKQYRLDKLHRPRDERIYEAPLVLLNQGFSNVAFFDYQVRFQHSLQSVVGPANDTEALMFLAAFLRSPLARYFIFHTAANVGTERDKAHLVEALRLPFFLPDSEAASSESKSIIKKVADKMRRLQKEMQKSADNLLQSKIAPAALAKKLDTWFITQREKAAKLQAELNPLIYTYYGLNGQEQALVEDTCEVLDRSDTPGSLDSARNIPTLRQLTANDDLMPYAEMLASTLNEWATGKVFAAVSGGVDAELGLALVEVAQVKTAKAFQPRSITQMLAKTLADLQSSSTTQQGSFVYERATLIFDGPRMLLLKPALLGQWTRIAALNDAGHIYAQITEARQQAARKT